MSLSEVQYFFQRHLPNFYLSLKSWEGATTDPATWSFLLLVHVFTEAHFVLGSKAKPRRETPAVRWLGLRPRGDRVWPVSDVPSEGGINSPIFSMFSMN